jgi:hypothetical protein
VNSKHTRRYERRFDDDDKVCDNLLYTVVQKQPFERANCLTSSFILEEASLEDISDT